MEAPTQKSRLAGGLRSTGAKPTLPISCRDGAVVRGLLPRQAPPDLIRLAP